MKRTIFFSTLFLFIGVLSCNSQRENNDSSYDDTEIDTAGYRDIDLQTFRSKMTEPDVVILDVRTPEETAEGVIDGAVILDYYDDGFSLALDSLDKEKTYLVYCRSGNRSGKACQIMQEKGFTKLYNLEGGYRAWLQE